MWKYLEGTEKDFKGAPEWATEVVWTDKGGESFVYWLNPETLQMQSPYFNKTLFDGNYGWHCYVKARREKVMNKFKIGDRVIYLEDPECKATVGGYDGNTVLIIRDDGVEGLAWPGFWGVDEASISKIHESLPNRAKPRYHKKRQKPKSRSTTSVIIGYDLGEGIFKYYTVKRVIGFTVRAEDGVVNITSEKIVSDGLTVRENTSIKFSELLAVHYLSPSEDLTYVFDEGKLIAKNQHKFTDNFVDHR